MTALSNASGSSSDIRALDIAKGVLVGARYCHPEAAFAEIVRAANKYRHPPLRLAQALVDAFADPAVDGADDPAVDIVRLEWGPILPLRTGHTLAS